jgi:hypothetical protein
MDLAGEAVTAFGITVLDHSGNPVAEMGRRIQQTGHHHDIGSVLSTAVLAKPILLEVLDNTRLVRGILMEEGCSLPARGAFRFFIQDTSGEIRFPLFQGNRPIREVKGSLKPSPPVGSAVDLEIQCDEKMYITLRVSVGREEFLLEVGPPPPPAVPAREEVDALLSELGSRLRNLEDEERTSFAQRGEALFHECKKALEAGDEAKAVSKFVDLEGLLKSIDLRTPKLQPPWCSVERIHAELLNIVQIASVMLPSFSRNNEGDRLKELFSDAREALMSGDQQLYKEATEALKSYGDALRKQLADIMTGGGMEDLPDDRKAAMYLDEIRDRATNMRMFAFAKARSDLDPALRSILSEAEKKEPFIGSDPREILRWCQQKRNELKKMKQMLVPDSEETGNRGGLLGLRASLGRQDFSIDKGAGGGQRKK